MRYLCAGGPLDGQEHECKPGVAIQIDEYAPLTAVAPAPCDSILDEKFWSKIKTHTYVCSQGVLVYKGFEERVVAPYFIGEHDV